MADQTDFKHITVNPGDDDDIVIVAGAPEKRDISSEGPSSDVGVEAAAASFESASNQSDQPDSPSEAASSNSPEAAIQEPNQDFDTNNGVPQKKPQVSSGKSKKDPEYHPTTLEDIDSSKMSKTQLVVIILAIVVIAAFVIWYIMFS